ncbi:MAG: helix-turn-helix domain-containing protein [Nitrososphaerota archaeon]
MIQDEVLTTSEAIKYLKTSRQTLIKLVREGRLPGNKIGRNYRFLKADLDRLIRGEKDNQIANR